MGASIFVTAYKQASKTLRGAVKHLGTTDLLDLEANSAESGCVEDETAVEDESRLLHRVVDLLPVEVLELLPLGRDDDRLGLLRCLNRRGGDSDRLLDCEAVSMLYLD